MARRVKSPIPFVLDMVEVYSACNIPRSSAALAYSLVLSFFPLLLCLNGLIALVHLDAQALLAALERFMPQAAASLVGEYVVYVAENQSPGLLYAGLFTIVVSASAGLRVLLDTMDELYGRPKDLSIGRVVQSVVFSLLFLITLYLSIVVILTGDWFLQFLEERLPREVVSLVDLPALSGLWRWMKYLLLFCFVMLLVLAVYAIGTPRGAATRLSILTGALGSSVALVAASVVFSEFIGMSSRYALVYGSLASLIILLVWLYLCGNILLLGAVFTRVWMKRSSFS